MKKKFRWRSFISFGLLYFFLILLFSGVILYITPPGRIANWTNWQLLGLTKSQWQTMHTNFSYLFALLSIFHLFTINWKTFWSYIRSKVKAGFNHKVEFILASLLTIIFFVGVIYGLPPFSSVMDIGENLKEGWEEQYAAPPVPHAEEFTIAQLSEDIIKVSDEKILSTLTALGIEVESSNQNLKELAGQVELSPQEIYNELTKLSHSGKGRIQPGGGIGRKNLQQISDENSIPLEELLLRLEDAGIPASGDDMIRDLADEYGMHPSEILTILNGEEGRANH
jgi:hypothetical protein